ncbi:DUF537-domain-containing protein [Coprinopsis marcescibilis]|uniref:DUF537-domain-containing protein n=1 Tax=Coprinopsis marcescibilis TaxID=230819 RepID=A0A5C3L159_COPMA|nr:DUF537-domain-containing protein [Coprinopsis marcescibilis]
MGHQKVAIFWDYENCPVPSGSSGYQVVKNIRNSVQSLGSIKLFKAYLAISEQFQPRSLSVWSELQSSGVSLTDTPHNGRKEVADKMIIVDMLLYAMDNTPPATFVLITGDRDFAYAISVLRLRQYDVVVLSPTHCHSSLTLQATACLDWTRDVLENGGKRPHPFNSPTTLTTLSSTSLDTPLLDRDRFVGEVSLEDYIPLPASPLKASYLAERDLLTARTEPITQPVRRWRRVNSVSSSSSFATCFSNLSQDTGFASSSEESRWSQVEASLSRSKSPTLSSSGIPSNSSPVNQEISICLDEATPVKTSSSPFLHSPTNSPHPLPVSLGHARQALSRTGSPFSTSSAAPGLTEPTSMVSGHSTAEIVVPTRFRALIKILQGYLARDIVRPFRPGVAMEVYIEDKSIYDSLPPDETRTYKFNKYIEMAVNYGIVEVGGSGGDAWISLRPRYHSFSLEEYH